MSWQAAGRRSHRRQSPTAGVRTRPGAPTCGRALPACRFATATPPPRAASWRWPRLPHAGSGNQGAGCRPARRAQASAAAPRHRWSPPAASPRAAGRRERPPVASGVIRHLRPGRDVGMGQAHVGDQARQVILRMAGVSGRWRPPDPRQPARRGREAPPHPAAGGPPRKADPPSPACCRWNRPR